VVEQADIEDDIPMSEAVADDTAVFENDTPQKQLQIALADAGVTEADFLKSLKATAPQLIGKAKTVTELSDDSANAALGDINEILVAIEGGLK
jgi:hypothetical protein